MPNICFSYSSDLPPGSANRGPAGQLPPGLRRMPVPCFSYSADGPLRDLRHMPQSCFSYLVDDLRRMPYTCFSYQADPPPGTQKRNSAP